ncbi:hypothetical protein LTR91_023393 [Friedmanniomyces endolithicus]|uniref:Glucose-methanol-choline oxidoreductase N-terminal domain-containing protein n=1 Tax=Friedmanniomyces endolithicus TaxID=329885 RepID=A0AAN6H4M0_9PEZI|nr:hypothetical protein LTR35_006727 [Friedmanniomyces endolithicus]KAK0297010.1 hypothetical protein LTS00_004289 [Friedmanniomyces endolithicus]KAK0315011.1 hypothetical protein LTR82_012792 [Friedmanniomyces endolithicus]KAK0928186.1 hypothetical protein LTR57_002920 [Friedmanniomyces endolithicus]KAK0954288.1 hypothetical protein LTR91_023393 [Friedmanniomyces endolithicus]
MEDTTPVTHDILILGAGTAGSLLANRLSEDPTLSILLLEAGQDHNRDERVYTPGLNTQLLDNRAFDWQYVSTPQPGLNGRTVKQPRGRVLGGSSAINSFALIYPSAAGLDAWADLGNEGWDWRGMKPYFRKFQTVCAPSETVRRELGLSHNDEGIRDTHGPLRACFPQVVYPRQKVWIETFRRLGLENRVEAMDGTALGGGISTCHIDGGTRERSHAGSAFFAPARERKNLRLVCGATVRRIVFEKGSDGLLRATGVKYTVEGIEYHVAVRKEVILAAGVFGSPQILELSGIGSPRILEEHGIDVVYANPNVGENLQDHMRAALLFEAADGVQFEPALPEAEARRLYETSLIGPWAERACHTFAYMPLQPFLSGEEKEDLRSVLDKHLIDPSLSPFEQKRNDFVRRMIDSPDEATATAYFALRPAPDPASKPMLALLSMLSHPLSRGTVHIRSADPFAKPTIDPGYYTHPLDLEMHARHMQSLEKLAQTEPLASLIKSGGARSPEGHDALTLERAKRLVQAHASTNYHPCGTCGMMPESIGGVVDARLKVYGTSNVRVVDASVMPIIPRGNIITTVYAMAEKAADITSQDLGIRRTT